MSARPLTLTHSGHTKETDAVRAVLAAYGWSVNERWVPAPELARMTGGKGQMHLPFGEGVFFGLPALLDHMVDKGIASIMPYV